MEGIVYILNSYLNGGTANPAQADVARHMLDHFDELAEMRLQDVAEACYTSSASIIRMVRSLGFSDYGAFREALRSEYQMMSAEPFGNNEAPLLSEGELDLAKARDWSNRLGLSLCTAYESVDVDKLRRLAQDIVEYHRVFVAGFGAARFFGDYLMYTMPFQGKGIVSLRDFDEIAQSSAGRDETLVVVVSQHGNLLRSDSDLLGRIRKQAGKVWLVTQVPRGRFNEAVVDDVLYVAGSGSYQADMFVMMGMAELLRQLCWDAGDR